MSKKIAILALCMAVLCTFSAAPAEVFAAGGDAGISGASSKAAQSKKKKKKPPQTEEEAAALRAESTDVGKNDGKDKVTAEQGKSKQKQNKKSVTISSFETSDSDVDISAKGAIIYDGDTGEVIYGKNAEKGYDPLSMTKIMTALMVMKRVEAGTLSLNEYATATKEDTNVVEVKMYISKGEKMNIQDLLYASLLESDNDAAAMLGTAIGGSKAGFADLMNLQAKWLGCTNTRFENANGLIEGDLHCSPHDMARIAHEAFKYDMIRKVCQTRKYRMPGIKLRPGGWTADLTNPFFQPHRKDKTPYKTYNIQGGKTGTWDYSNASLLEVAKIDGHEVITVVMKTPLDKRYSDTRRLLNYAKSVYKERKAIEKAAAVRAASREKELGKLSDNEYIREIDKTPVAKAFFKYMNNLFWRSCVEIKSAYKTKGKDIDLKWEKRPAADGYLVYRSTDGGEYVKVNNTESGEKTSFRDVNIEPNHVYKYFVRAYRWDSILPCV